MHIVIASDVFATVHQPLRSKKDLSVVSRRGILTLMY